MTSLHGYERNLGTLGKEIGHIAIGNLTGLHIDEAMAALKTGGGVSRKKPKDGEARGNRPLSDRTLHHLFRIGSAVMKQAVKWKLIASNPFDDSSPPKVEDKEIVLMSEAEAKRVFQAAVQAHESGKHPGLDLAVALLYCTGIRRSELLGIAFDCIYDDEKEPWMRIVRTVVKGRKGEPIFREKKTKSKKSSRIVSLPVELIPLIRRHRQWVNEQIIKWGRAAYQKEPLLLFPDFGGAPLTPGKMTERLRQLHRQARVVGVQPTHGFRHGMASQMVADNIDIKTVSERLGHSTVGFTLSRYVHPVSGKDMAAAAKLGEQFRALSDG